MSDNNTELSSGAFFIIIILLGLVFFAGWLVGGFVHGYVSDYTTIEFRIAENITSNMTVKEKLELIKTSCADFYERNSCYSEMYKRFIKPQVVP